MRRGQKGPNIEYVKVCPKFVQDIRDKLNPPSQLEDKKQKLKHQYEEQNEQESYDIENAILEGDEEDIEQIKIQIQENKSKLDLDKFKPVFQNKKSKKEDKQETKTTLSVEKQLQENNKTDQVENEKKNNQSDKQKSRAEIIDKKKRGKQQSLLSFNTDL